MKLNLGIAFFFIFAVSSCFAFDKVNFDPASLDFGKLITGIPKSLETTVKRGVFEGCFCVVLSDAPPFQFKMITPSILSGGIGHRQGTAEATIPGTTAPGTYLRPAQVTIRSCNNTNFPCTEGAIIETGTYSLKAIVVLPLEPNPTSLNFLNATPLRPTIKNLTLTANAPQGLTISNITLQQSSNVFAISPTGVIPLIGGQSKTFNVTFSGTPGTFNATIEINYIFSGTSTVLFLRIPVSANTAVPQTP